MEKKNLIREKPFTSQRTDKKRNFRYNDSKNKIKKKLKLYPQRKISQLIRIITIIQILTTLNLS